MFNQKVFAAFQKHVPDNVVHYCYDLWAEHQFVLKIKRGRNSKFGDYRYNVVEKTHTITINNDLNQFAFLITYIHEIAHLVTQKNHGSRVQPHGKEWKKHFRDLLLPLCNNLVFPDPIRLPLINYLKNPKASSCSDPKLFIALRSFDEQSQGMLYLSQLKVGDKFLFNNRMFQKEHIRRTRALCKETLSGKKYLISSIALVEPVQ
jgi:SprT protein